MKKQISHRWNSKMEARLLQVLVVVACLTPTVSHGGKGGGPSGARFTASSPEQRMRVSGEEAAKLAEIQQHLALEQGWSRRPGIETDAGVDRSVELRAPVDVLLEGIRRREGKKRDQRMFVTPATHRDDSRPARKATQAAGTIMVEDSWITIHGEHAVVGVRLELPETTARGNEFEGVLQKLGAMLASDDRMPEVLREDGGKIVVEFTNGETVALKFQDTAVDRRPKAFIVAGLTE